MSNPNKKARGLIWDIETAPMVVQTWSLFPKMIGHDAILRDWYIIGGAWKFTDSKKVHTSYVDPAEASRYLVYGRDEGPDACVATALRDALLEADFIVAHNGDSFDLKKLNARLIYWGLDPLPSIPTVDTLKQARRIAKFSSNRLDYLARHLHGGGKLQNMPGLWTRALKGDPKALKQMERYNKRDVTELEKLYRHLRPYMKSHPNVNLLREVEGHACPRCGSSNTQRRGWARARTRAYQRFQCLDCGAWSQAQKSGEGDPGLLN